MRRLLVATLLAAAATPAAAVTTVTFDFEALPAGPLAGDMLVQSDPALTATFSGLGLQLRDLSFLGYGSRALSTASDSQVITVLFDRDIDLVTIINPLNSDVGGEIDVIEIRAFDAGGNFLGSTIGDAEGISLGIPNIRSLTFDDVGTGYVIEALSARIPDVVVPAPATMALFGLGLAALGLARRR